MSVEERKVALGIMEERSKKIMEKIKKWPSKKDKAATQQVGQWGYLIGVPSYAEG
jgi:hypothetical protein